MLHRSDDLFDLWFPLGVLLGIALTALASLGAGAENFSKFVIDYQIIIGAVIAIFTASWTIRAHMKSSNHEISTAIETTGQQIRASQQIEEARREERLRAARAMLPFALTEIVAFSESTVQDLAALLQPYPSNNNSDTLVFMTSGPSFTLKQVPTGALDRIRDLIETSPPRIAVDLGSLLSNVQIFASRLGAMQKWNGSGFADEKKELTVLARIIDMFELYVQANRFFDYGRLKTENVRLGPVRLSEVLAAASDMALIVRDSRTDTLIRERFPV